MSAGCTQMPPGPSIADLGALLAHLATRCTSALQLIECAIERDQVSMLVPLADCIAAMGFIADTAAVACGETPVCGGANAWLCDGRAGSALAALERLATDRSSPLGQEGGAA